MDFFPTHVGPDSNLDVVLHCNDWRKQKSSYLEAQCFPSRQSIVGNKQRAEIWHFASRVQICPEISLSIFSSMCTRMVIATVRGLGKARKGSKN